MSVDFIKLVKKSVQGLDPYQPGKPIDELKRELGLTDVVKLASNENPLGLSAKIKAVLTNNLDDLSRYPDGAGFALKKALSDKLGLHPRQITLGNGSNDLLTLIGLCFLDENVSAIFSEYAFIVYPSLVQQLGAKAIKVPAKNWGHDLKAMLAAVQKDTRVVFIANPNNPTGTWLEHEEVHDFMRKIRKDIVVVLDEAYAEYIHDTDYADGLVLQKEFPNLIVTRTFSKAYGLAGLRVGYSVSTSEMADILDRVREPFNVNTLGQVAAIEALKDAAYIEKTIRINDEGRQQLEEGLLALGFNFIPSQGNFVTFDTQGDAMALYKKLLMKGVIVRPLLPYGMPNHLRVSIGMDYENAYFLYALKQVL